MGVLLNFFSKNSLFLFFLLLQIVSGVLIFTKNAMQKSWIAAQTSAFNAWVSGYIDEGASYLKLKQVNEDLIAQNKQLMEQLYGKQHATLPKNVRMEDSISGGKQVFLIIDGDIINNSINRKNNYFTINRGKKHGIESNMAVISPKGIAGIVVNTTANYALVQSVLSMDKIRINASLKNSDYFGTLTWRGEDSRMMHLSDIPKYVPIKVGDTIVTDGKSAIFPQGKMIGTIAGYEVDKKTGFWDISVELSERMGQLSKIFVVKNLRKEQYQPIQDSLQAQIKKDEEK